MIELEENVYYTYIEINLTNTITLLYTQIFTDFIDFTFDEKKHCAYVIASSIVRKKKKKS